MQRVASVLRQDADVVATATSLLALVVTVFCHTSQFLTCLLSIVFALSLVILASVTDPRNYLIHAVAVVTGAVYVYLLFNTFALAPAADTWYYSGTAEMVRRGEFCSGTILPLDAFMDIGQPSHSFSFLQYPIGLAARVLEWDTLTAFLLSGLPILVLLIYGIYMLFSYSFARRHGLVIAICYVFVFVWHTPNFWTSDQYTYPMELLTMSWPPVQVQAFLVWMLYFGIRGINENKTSFLVISGLFWALAMWTRTYAYPAPVLLLALVPWQVKHLRSAHSLQQGKLHLLKTLFLPHLK
ncbi:MAG: hypothetical protein QUS09_08660, partial [Methanotrichaceae archaeon]|nr:hypothetical protein [Methanotrichaceae archaeon]